YWGAATLILAAVPLLLALAWAGSTYPWASPQVTGLLAFSALAWFTFIWLENRAREPILPLSFFKNSIFVVSTAVVLTLGMGMFGTIMFVPLFIQGVIGFSATSSGVVTMPMSIALAIGSTLGGQWMSRWSHYRIIGLTGIIIATTGMYLLSRMGVDTTYASAVRNMLVLGFGLGITMPIFVVVVQNALPYSQLGAVTSAIQFFRSIGGTLGVAIMGSLLTTRLSMELPRQIPPQVKQAIPPEQFSQFVNPQILVNPSILTQVQQQFSQLGPQGRELFQQLLEGLKSALALSIHEAFLVGLVIVALAIIACLFLKEIPLRKTHGPVFEEVASGAIREGVD
ncbi:MAG: MFS transporter, partial [Chloroflexi bacterium]|nr:MFS transporter [Chloroflexota bacterium]